MNIDQITTKCWILALIIRDDGERLLLGDGWFDFKDNLQHFQPNSIANDIVELQGTDGQLLAGQVRRSASQSFDGYIGDALTSKTEIENRRRQFIQFFRTRRHYKVIYIFPDGTAIQRRMGYLTDAPSVPEMWQKFPEYHVALNFEDVNYYEYAEDAQGDEIYAHESLVKLISVQSGGLVWDEYGAVSHGYTWLNPQTVTGDYITVTDGATGSPLTLSQLTGNAEQTTYSGKNLISARPSSGSANGITWTLNSDGSVKVSGTATANHVISFGSVSMAQGQTYTLSGCPSGGAVGKYMLYTNVVDPQFKDIGSGATDTVIANATAQVNFIVYSGRTINGTIYPMLEIGSSASPYEPYVGGTASPNPDYPQPISTVTGEQTVKITGSDESQEFEVNLGKNLFDIEQGVTQFTNYSGSVVNNWGSYTDGVLTMTVTNGQNGFVGFSGFKPTLVEGQTYTLSADVYLSGAASTTSIRVGLSPHSSSSPDYLSSKDAWISFSKTYTATASDVADPRLCIEAWSSGAQLQVKNLQLERGSTKSDFAPYFTPIELAKIGNYQDRIYKEDGKWYVEKQVGKVVLDGANSSAWGVANSGTPNYIYYWQTIQNALVTQNGLISNYGAWGSIGGSDTNQGMQIVNNGLLRVRYGEEMPIADWKAKVAATPMILYYALVTPTTTEITDEALRAQLNFIASLYGGVNNISIVGTGAQGEMTLNYYADVDTTGAGYEWEAGEGGGPTTVQVIGVDNAQPIWTVTGPATNPTLTNITTAQTITWNGTVPNGQKLIIDMANQTATLAGANVYEFITGSWLTLRPGANKLTYSAQGADQASQIQWNGVVG